MMDPVLRRSDPVGKYKRQLSRAVSISRESIFEATTSHHLLDNVCIWEHPPDRHGLGERGARADGRKLHEILQGEQLIQVNK